MAKRQAKTKTPPRAVIVHSLADACAALRAAEALGVPLCLRSAVGAAGYAGPGWWREMVAAAVAGFPGVAVTASLDCADAPGDALAAVRAGARLIRLEAPRRVRAAVAAMAAAAGARLDDDRAPALDLAGAVDPETACRQWLGGKRGGTAGS
jgi:hypothetical protein